MIQSSFIASPVAPGAARADRAERGDRGGATWLDELGRSGERPRDDDGGDGAIAPGGAAGRDPRGGATGGGGVPDGRDERRGDVERRGSAGNGEAPAGGRERPGADAPDAGATPRPAPAPADPLPLAPRDGVTPVGGADDDATAGGSPAATTRRAGAPGETAGWTGRATPAREPGAAEAPVARQGTGTPADPGVDPGAEPTRPRPETGEPAVPLAPRGDVRPADPDVPGTPGPRRGVERDGRAERQEAGRPAPETGTAPASGREDGRPTSGADTRGAATDARRPAGGADGPVSPAEESLVEPAAETEGADAADVPEATIVRERRDVGEPRREAGGATRGNDASAPRVDEPRSGRPDADDEAARQETERPARVVPAGAVSAPEADAATDAPAARPVAAETARLLRLARASVASVGPRAAPAAPIPIADAVDVTPEQRALAAEILATARVRFRGDGPRVAATAPVAPANEGPSLRERARAGGRADAAGPPREVVADDGGPDAAPRGAPEAAPAARTPTVAGHDVAARDAARAFERVVQDAGNPAGKPLVVAPGGGFVPAPGAAPAPTPVVPVDRLAEAIAARARTAERPGVIELRFALEPDDLGPVRVRLETSADRVVVRLLAASGAAASQLGQAVPRLIAHLQEAGFADARVDLGYAGGDSGAADRGHDSRRERRVHGGGSRDDAASRVEAGPSARPRARAAGLDLVA